MKSHEVKNELNGISNEYMELIRPLVEQAVCNGAHFGALHMNAANMVRTDLAHKFVESMEFTGELYNKTGIYELAEKEWTGQMDSMQSVILPNGDPWLPNFDAKSAREAFMAGVRFMQKIALERILQILSDLPEAE